MAEHFKQNKKKKPGICKMGSKRWESKIVVSEKFGRVRLMLGGKIILVIF